MRYINTRYRGGPVETIDQFDTYREAAENAREYRMAFGPDFKIWVSRRATRDWRES